jgi:hypothetical protein
LQEWKHGEGQLQRQHHLTEGEQITTPNRAEMTCMKIAIRLASPTTHKSPYLN